MEQKPALMKSSLTSGFYIGVVSILVSVILYVAGLMFETWAAYISYAILIAGAVYAQLSYRKSLGGEMTYSQALGAGVLALIFASVLSAIYAYLLYAVIDPSLIDQIRITTEQRMIEQGNIPEEQLDQIVDVMMRFQKPPIMAGMAVLVGAIGGLIISLITGIFTKKNPTDEVPE
jgi:hypothetical protein